MQPCPESDRAAPLATRHGSPGFSLLELSVVLAIISVIAVMGLEMTANYMNRTAYKVTAERLEAIDQAIVRYRKVYNKLPCPTYLNWDPPNACYGKEANGTSGCNDTAGACSAASIYVGAPYVNLVRGWVPVRDLGLPMSMMMDGYGSRINYITNVNLTYNLTYTPGDPNDSFNNAPDGIIIRSGKIDAVCGTAGSVCQNRGTASYVLLSVGADRRGGIGADSYTSGAYNCTYPDSVTAANWPDTANCRFGTGYTLSKGGAPQAINLDVFYDSRFNAGTGDAKFDDLIKWRSKGNL